MNKTTSKLVGPGEHAAMPMIRYQENEVEAKPYPLLCLACGIHHGSIGAELVCLRHTALRQARFEALRKQIAGLRPWWKAARPRP